MESDNIPIRPGQMIPDFSLPSTAGRPVRITDYRQRNNLVLLFAAPDERELARLLLEQLQAARSGFIEENAQILAVLPAPLLEAERLKDATGVEYPILADERGLTRRFLLDDSGAGQHTSVYIVDRYGEIYAIQRPESGGTLPGPNEILDWVRLIELQCPE